MSGHLHNLFRGKAEVLQRCERFVHGGKVFGPSRVCGNLDDLLRREFERLQSSQAHNLWRGRHGWCSRGCGGLNLLLLLCLRLGLELLLLLLVE